MWSCGLIEMKNIREETLMIVELELTPPTSCEIWRSKRVCKSSISKTVCILLCGKEILRSVAGILVLEKFSLMLQCWVLTHM